MISKTETRIRGTEGESFAGRYLEAQGLKVLCRQYLTRWGEIDLVCLDPKGAYVFVEVKARARSSSLPAVEAITLSKQKKIVGAALSYMKRYGLKDRDMRFDVVVIEGDRLEWLPGAFEPVVPYTY